MLFQKTSIRQPHPRPPSHARRVKEIQGGGGPKGSNFRGGGGGL